MKSGYPEFAAFHSKNGCARPDPVSLLLIQLWQEGRFYYIILMKNHYHLQILMINTVTKVLSIE